MKEDNKRFIKSIEKSVQGGNKRYAIKKCGLLNERYITNDEILDLAFILLHNKSYLSLFLISLILMVAVTVTVLFITGTLTLLYSLLVTKFSVVTSGTICLLLFICVIVKFDCKRQR